MVGNKNMELREASGIEEIDSKKDLVGEDKLPFPRATITNLIRKNISKNKQLNGTVKDEMNLWVDSLIKKIVKKMDSQPYTFVNYQMLSDAVAPYEEIQGIDEQRGELIKKINEIRVDCVEVINSIDSASKQKKISLKLNEGEELSFPRATITNKIRQNLGEGKTIKGPVKKGLNVWLGRMVQRVSKKMDSFPYSYVDRSMFKEAIESYEAVSEIELQKERIIQQMESIKISCDLLSMEIERKFRL